jgi:hypothetical protein
MSSSPSLPHTISFYIYHLGHERSINYRRHQPETRYDSTATLQADEVVARMEGHTSTIQGNHSSEDVSQRAITGCTLEMNKVV